MATTTGNLSAIGKYDPATAKIQPRSNTSIGTNAQEIQDNFMKMLTVQLQNQNPLNPMDNAQFASQLAQLSQLQGIEGMRASIESFVSQMASSKLFDQAGLVGKSVLTKRSSVELGNVGDVWISVASGQMLSSVVMTITGPDGTVVDKVQLGSLGTELKDFSWDGLTTQGSRLPAGSYTVKVEGKNSFGAVTSADVLSEARIDAVRRVGSDIKFVLNNGSIVGQSDVFEVGSSSI